MRDLPRPQDPDKNVTELMNNEIESITAAIKSLNPEKMLYPNYVATYKSIGKDSIDKFESLNPDITITKQYINSDDFKSYKNFITTLENINAITGLGTLDFTDRLAKLDLIDCTCRYDIAHNLNKSLFNYNDEFKDIVEFMKNT